MFFLKKRGKLVAFILEMIKKRLPKSQKLENLKSTVAQTAENAAFISFQVKEIEPYVDEIKLHSKRLENEINQVKASFERKFGPLDKKEE